MSVVHVKGLAELNKFLQELPVKLERNVMRSALRAGANVVRDAARGNVVSRSGRLARSIKVGTKTRGSEVIANVSTNLFYARFMEYGTRPHRIEASKRHKESALALGMTFRAAVDHPGTAPRPFLRPALDTRVTEVVIAVGQQIKARLTKEGLNVAHVTVEGDE